MDDLQRTFDICCNEPLLVLEPQGNYGDYLIFKGFEKMINEMGISYTPVRRRSSIGRFRGHMSIIASAFSFGKQYKTVYIHGGGNFNDLWGDGVHLFNLATDHYDCPIIVGPQSCIFDNTNPMDIFERVENRVHFFCREKYSYQNLKPITEEFDNVSIHLSKDTALYLQPEDFPNINSKSEYVLVALREDKESASPSLNIHQNKRVLESDISVKADSLIEFVNTIASAEKVYTDRLHVAITAAIFKTETVFFDNTYHKNRGVYEYSLKNMDFINFRYLRD